jgi:tripartite-type tricarboxylate transporter receptor subunit TctC
MLMANQGPMAVNPHLFKSLKIDTLTAFDPITLVASAPLVVVVPESSSCKSLKDLITEAQNAPGKLNYGSAGNGSASHLATVLLNLTANIDTVHLAYRGAGPAIVDLLGSRTQFMVTTIPSVTGLLTTGKLRPLAVTGKTRTPLMKDVPTVAESGYPDYDASAWYGFVVPHETPGDVVSTLHKATAEALTDDTVRERLATDGAVPVGNSAEEFGAFIKAEHARWKKVIAAANIRVD